MTDFSGTTWPEKDMAKFVLARCAEYKQRVSHLWADFAYLTAIENIIKASYFLDDPEGPIGCIAAYSEGQACGYFDKTIRILAAVWKQHPDYKAEWALDLYHE
jgi:hypothetical protein